jgi:hypothetical protein
MKVLAARRDDGNDIRFLIQRPGLVSVDQLLAVHAEALPDEPVLVCCPPAHTKRVGQRLQWCRDPTMAGAREAAGSLRFRSIGVLLDLVSVKDAANRASMAPDCVEAISPTVDACVLEFLEEGTFSSNDVGELPSGEVRLSTRLRQ